MTFPPVARPSENVGKIRVLIAERDRMASQLLAEALERDTRFEVVALPSPTELLSVVALRKFDVAVISVDFTARAKKGLQFARTLNLRFPNIRIVMLLDLVVRESVVPSFRSGATGVFCRTEPVSDFRACVEQVSRGEIWAKDSAAGHLLEALRNSPSCDAFEGSVGMLSKREIDVVECAIRGQTNKQIASSLRLSQHTVKNYIFRVFEKLGVSNRMELLFLLSNHRKHSLSVAASSIGSGTGSLEGHQWAHEGQFLPSSLSDRRIVKTGALKRMSSPHP